jgi:nucleoside-diphosphate-sugar epimerase
MDVLVAGAGGALGLRLVPQLVAKGASRQGLAGVRRWSGFLELDTRAVTPLKAEPAAAAAPGDVAAGPSRHDLRGLNEEQHVR